MRTFEVEVERRWGNQGIVREKCRVKAGEVDVAVKRVLGGGWRAGYRNASVCESYRVRMAKGEVLTVRVVERRGGTE